VSDEERGAFDRHRRGADEGAFDDGTMPLDPVAARAQEGDLAAAAPKTRKRGAFQKVSRKRRRRDDAAGRPVGLAGAVEGLGAFGLGASVFAAAGAVWLFVRRARTFGSDMEMTPFTVSNDYDRAAV
jgi:hypothetical protein